MGKLVVGVHVYPMQGWSAGGILKRGQWCQHLDFIMPLPTVLAIGNTCTHQLRARLSSDCSLNPPPSLVDGCGVVVSRSILPLPLTLTLALTLALTLSFGVGRVTARRKRKKSKQMFSPTKRQTDRKKRT